MAETARRSPAACAIVSRNYLCDARVVAHSYLHHHPGARFYLLVVDKLPPGTFAGESIQVIDPEDLDLPYFAEMCFKYNATELCTALKPTLIKHLIDRYKEDDVIYFDSDILVMRKLDELLDAMPSANIVLTPHLLAPIPQDGLFPAEPDILAAGTHNLGFIAVRNSDVTRKFLQWWESRLRDGCFIEFSKGLLTDQRWVDLVPGYFPGTVTLKDETYNVAYWNIHSRPIEHTGDVFSVHGRPIAFFHFSGFDPARPDVFSAHQNRTRIEPGTGLSDLIDLYVRLQSEAGFRTVRKWKYGFGSFDNGATISSPIRRLYVNLAAARRAAFGDPFRTAGVQSFFQWATEPETTTGLSPFLTMLRELRPDVAIAYPDVDGEDREPFLHWAATNGAAELKYDPRAMGIDGKGGAPADRRVKASIIIPVYNNASLTQTCIDRVLATTNDGDAYEIIVTNDGSTDHTDDLLKSYGDRIRVVSRNTNTGFAVACNDGAAIAQGACLVFLNNDTVPQAGWLDALVKYADAHHEAAIVGAKLLFPDETVQHAGFVFCEDSEPRHIYTGFPSEHPAVNQSRAYQAVTGACFLIRREDFERAKGFDTTFHNGYEDVDLCLRVGALGREVHYCHESVLYHLESASRGETKSQDDLRNCKIYRERWADRVRSDEFHYYVKDRLLRVEYRALYPLSFSISPLLAVVNGSERDRQADRLLESRSRQVIGLLKDNIRLNVRVQEAQFRPRAAAAVTNEPSARFSEPQVIVQGHTLCLSNESKGQLVSVILPVKNGAPKLRHLLPAILSQRTTDQVEIIAVDSASTDESVELLKDANATVIAIDPRSFNHGITRNLATKYAHGRIFVFLNQSTLPADEHWLTNLVRPFDSNPSLAGVCGRMLPRRDADILTARDINRNVNASTRRIVTSITDWNEYRSLAPEALRMFVNFHSLSAAVRANVFEQIPFREADFAEDLIWGREVLEAGHQIQFEPSAVALHSHNYSVLDTFRRNFDDGAACRKIVGRMLNEKDVAPGIMHEVRGDWRYLENECAFDGEELERWCIIAAMRRTAQILGHWIGVNSEQANGNMSSLLSITQQIKAGAKTEEQEWQSSTRARA